MKLFIGVPLSWLCYWLGDLVSRPMHWWPQPAWAKLYHPYNKLMNWSREVQDWCGAKGPWHDV